MITYNHERFIKQAVESVLMQKVNFQYELVVGEDCSTDRTGPIAIEYEQRYPDRIRLLLAERNLGIGANFLRTLKACQGRYVALLEGDDYWTSSNKLQKQVDFLDAHAECSICFHTVRVVFEDEKKTRLYPSRTGKEVFGLHDILCSNFMHTCSVMFRNGLIDEFPEWFVRLRPEDWALHILNAQKGKIGLIKDVMAVYRVHSGGTWSKKGLIPRLEESIRMLRHVNGHLGFRYDKVIGGTISAFHFDLALEHAREGNTVEARKYARICTAEYRRYGRLSVTLLVAMWLIVWFAKLDRFVTSAPKILVDSIRTWLMVASMQAL